MIHPAFCGMGGDALTHTGNLLYRYKWDHNEIALVKSLVVYIFTQHFKAHEHIKFSSIFTVQPLDGLVGPYNFINMAPLNIV